MPPAAALPIAIGASGAASAAGGKKGNGLAKQQLQLQQDQLAFGKNLVNTGMEAWQPSKDYWTSLLQGGPAATTAVGPYAAQLRTQGTGAANAIQAGLPAGGERNLALANNNAGTYSQIQRLTAGVQPTAASALGQLSGVPISAGTSATGQAVSLAPTLLGNQQATKGANASGATGLGNLLYNSINKPRSASGGATNGTPGSEK